MFRADYHIHTEFSFDSEANIDDICLTAIDRNLSEIAITDHLDFFSEKPYDHILDVKSCYEAIANARDKYGEKLAILFGAELGQPQRNPQSTINFYNDFKPDFVIGSIHNMDNDEDIYDYDWSHLDHYDFYHKYLAWELDLAKNYDFDVLGHLTYPLRCMFEANGKTFDLRPFTDSFRELFKTIIEKGKGIECNTSGLLQKLGEPLPRLEILKLYKECGGEIITVGSDAHLPDKVGLTIPQGYELIREAGFKYISTYRARKVSFIPI